MHGMTAGYHEVNSSLSSDAGVIEWEAWWDHQLPPIPQESSRHRHLTSVGAKRPSDPSSGANGASLRPQRVRGVAQCDLKIDPKEEIECKGSSK